MFGENEKWSWNKAKKNISAGVENSDNEVQIEPNVIPEAPIQEETEVPNNTNDGAPTSTSVEGRVRRPPGYLSIYDTSTDDINDDDKVRNLVNFGPCHNDDLVTYEVVKFGDGKKKSYPRQINFYYIFSP
jgi:hypothetical protein